MMSWLGMNTDVNKEWAIINDEGDEDEDDDDSGGEYVICD